MAKKDINKTLISSDAEFFSCIDKIADRITKRNLLKAKNDKITLRTREKYGIPLKAEEEAIDLEMDQVIAYAKVHRKRLLPGEKKSSETVKSEWGFYFGKPAVLVANDDETEADVIKRIQEKKLTDFLSLKDPALDKNKIKKGMTSEQLVEVGLKIDKVENFFVDPKTDSSERITVSQS